MVLSPPAPALGVPALEQAYEDCRVETERWAKTFYLGMLLMPPAKRRAIWAIYVWCRRTDELMDSPEAQALPVAELSARLDAWEQRTRELLAARRPELSMPRSGPPGRGCRSRGQPGG